MKDVAKPWIVDRRVSGDGPRARASRSPRSAATSRRAAPPRPAAASKPLLPAPPARPFLMFVSLIPDDSFKHVVIAPLDAPDGARYLTPLQCDRVYYAGSRGLCLDRGRRSTPASRATSRACSTSTSRRSTP